MTNDPLRYPPSLALTACAAVLVVPGCYTGLGSGPGPGLGIDTVGDGDGDGDGDGNGDDDDDGAPSPPESLCEVPQPGPSPIRRLTRLEYDNTVRDLLGDDSRPAASFIGEQTIEGFDNNALGASSSRPIIEQYEAAAKQLAETAVTDLDALLECDPAVEGEQECIESFVGRFVARAYRRPVSDDELNDLVGLFEERRAETDFASAVRLTLQAVLQSPYFLYRVELGDPSTNDGETVALTSYEIASRLSYLLWNSMPDDALFVAAEADALRTPEQIAGEVDRMLADPKASSVLADFHEQWLRLRGQLPSELADVDASVRGETTRFIEEVVLRGDGRLGTLLDADFTFANRDLAELYGLPGAESFGDELERVDLDPEHRSGLLTHALVLGTNSEEHESSPILRAVFVREQLLCETLPAPPADEVIEPPDPDPNATTRERYAQHREDPMCAACHVLLDPLGFAFEHYDQLGRWRDLENGFPIDASAEFNGATDPALQGPFYGAIELGDRLADSETVRNCAVATWFRYAYGRLLEDEIDACTLEYLQQRFADSEGDVRDLLVALTQTDAFRFRAVAGQE